MNKFRIYRAVLALVTIALLATVFLLLHAPNRHVVASERSLSPLAPQADLKQFEGCWGGGSYSLYIAVIDDDELIGKIRCNCGDPQKLYDIKVSGNTMTGKWESDPEFKDGGKGKKRRGTFMLSRKGNELNGTAREGKDSEVEGFRGTDWNWSWTRQTDTKMCDEKK